MPSYERSRHDLIWKITPPPTDGEQTGAPDVKVLRPHELFPAPSSGQMQKINALREICHPTDATRRQDVPQKLIFNDPS